MRSVFWFAVRQVLALIVLIPMLIWATFNHIGSWAWLLGLSLWLIPAVFNINRYIEDWQCRVRDREALRKLEKDDYDEDSEYGAR